MNIRTITLSLLLPIIPFCTYAQTTTPVEPQKPPMSAQFINDFAKMIDSTIVARMGEFKVIYEEFKELRERANKALLDKKTLMAKIYADLMPLEDRLRILYPDFIPWFDNIKRFMTDHNIQDIVEMEGK